MKIKELFTEMTSVSPSLSVPMENYRKLMEPKIKAEGSKIGEIEDKDLYELDYGPYKLYGLYFNSKLVSLISGEFIKIPNQRKKFLEISGMVTDTKFSGNALTTKIFTFLKSRKKLKILIGNLISKANKRNFEKLASNPDFNIQWLNVKSGETTNFDNEPNEKFREGGKASDWQILFEHNEIFEHQFETKEYPLNYSDFDLLSHYHWWDFTNAI